MPPSTRDVAPATVRQRRGFQDPPVPMMFPLFVTIFLCGGAALLSAIFAK